LTPETARILAAEKRVGELEFENSRLKRGASFSRGSSEQNYETPAEFIRAVERRFGPLKVDLAATAVNTKAPKYITPEQDSLLVPWPSSGLLWLNPPFSNITPWAKKCVENSTIFHPTSKILLLVPASVGSNWFRDYVHKKALVLFLNGRISFDGKNPYPKDCILVVYRYRPEYQIWTWRD
jgi:phage N-6-adenine-methyltransferase